MTSIRTLIFSRTIRFFTKALAFLLLLIAALLIIVRFSPQTVLYIANFYSPYEIVAERVDTEFLPLTFKFRNVRISEEDDQKLAHLQGLVLSADWIGAINGRYNFWDIELSDGVVDLRKLPEQENTDITQDDKEASPKLDLHRLISTLSARVSNVKLVINDSAYVDLQNIDSSSSEVSNALPSDLIQNIDMQFVYTFEERPLVINAKMESLQKEGVTDIKVDLAKIDLSPISQTTGTVETIDAGSASSNLIQKEQEMDWAWLKMIDATRIILSVDKLVYPGVDAGSIRSQLVLDDDISFDVSTDLSLDIADNLKFKDTLSLVGRFAPIDKITSGADLKGDIRFKTPKVDFQMGGNFNLNGQFENNFGVLISASSMPVETIPATSADSLIGKFYPLNAEFDIQSQSRQIDLANIDVEMGESDLKGNLSLTFLDNQSLKLKGKLSSEKLVLEPTEDSKQEIEPEVSKNSQRNKVFDDDVIDWSWLDNKDLDLLISIQELVYSKYKLSAIHLPIVLNQGALNIAGFNAQFAGGEWKSSLSIKKLAEGAALSLETDLSNATLEAMNLIPSDQITQGETNLSARLVSNGASSKQMAEALDGNLLLDIREGRIANDYFEIIGSDLFSELLNKLNPFVKSDPTTELKCMVANLKFDQGKIHVDKSIALATSKISVVADGDIDLAEEKVKLKIVPRTENGIGLGIGTLVKSVSLGGTLANPVPHVTAGDLLKSGLALGVALTTGGTSLLADGVLSKAVGANACKRAEKAFTSEAKKLDEIERAEQLERQKLIEQQELLETSTESPTN